MNKKQLTSLILLLSALSMQSANAVLINFSGSEFPTTDPNEQVFGSVLIPDSLIDGDPDPRKGTYTGISPNINLSIFGSVITVTDPVVLRVVDGAGCDCFFLSIQIEKVVFGQLAKEITVNIQDEAGSLGGNMIVGDEIPQQTMIFPRGTFKALTFTGESRQFIANIDLNTFSIHSVPEPKLTILFILTLYLLIQICARRRLLARDLC